MIFLSSLANFMGAGYYTENYNELSHKNDCLSQKISYLRKNKAWLQYNIMKQYLTFSNRKKNFLPYIFRCRKLPRNLP